MTDNNDALLSRIVRKIIDEGRSVIEYRTTDTWFDGSDGVESVAIEFEPGTICSTIHASKNMTENPLSRLYVEDATEENREWRILVAHIPEETYYNVSVESGKIRNWWELQHS